MKINNRVVLSLFTLNITPLVNIVIDCTKFLVNGICDDKSYNIYIIYNNNRYYYFYYSDSRSRYMLATVIDCCRIQRSSH